MSAACEEKLEGWKKMAQSVVDQSINPDWQSETCKLIKNHVCVAWWNEVKNKHINSQHGSSKSKVH